VCKRTERLILAYLSELGTALLPDAILFRNRSGLAYIDATLSHDFAALRAIVFPGDDRRLMDMRRSGTVEAIAGNADALGLSAKMANSIDRSNALHKNFVQPRLARRWVRGGCGQARRDESRRQDTRTQRHGRS
jgi:hypothetical protein